MADYTGSVLELKGSRATVITNKCDFLVIRRSKGMFVGQQVEFSKSDICSSGKSYKKYLAIAASVCIIICSYFLYYQFYMPSRVFAYIDVDINPSIEFTVDKDKHVISAKPLNEDAKRLVDEEDFKKLLIADAIEKVIKECEKDGFIKTDSETDILVSGSPDSETDKNKARLDSILTEITSKIRQDNTNINAECIKVKLEERAQAVENNISMGRYALYSKIRQDDSSITVEQAKSSKVSEIIDKAMKKTLKDSDKKDKDSGISKQGDAQIKDGNSQEHSNSKTNGNLKKSDDKQSSSDATEPEDDKNTEGSSDKQEQKKDNSSTAGDRQKGSGETKTKGEKSDSRDRSVVTSAPEVSDSGVKENTDSSRTDNSGANDNKKDSTKEEKNQDKTTDNKSNVNEHKVKSKK